MTGPSVPRLAAGMLATGLVLAVATYRAPNQHRAVQRSTVGGVVVPDGLTCAEDEIVGFVAPRTLGCVHQEAGVLGR